MSEKKQQFEFVKGLAKESVATEESQRGREQQMSAAMLVAPVKRK